MRREGRSPRCAVPLGSAKAIAGSLLLEALRKEDRPVSKVQPPMTAGSDLADKYSYPCASSTKRMARSWRKVGCAQPLRL